MLYWYTSYKLKKCRIAIAVENTKLKIAIIILSSIFVSAELIWKLAALNKQGSRPTVAKLIALQLTRRMLRICFMLTLSWVIVSSSSAYDAQVKILYGLIYNNTIVTIDHESECFSHTVKLK